MSIDIIPAIDLMGGKCVRLERGDFSKAKAYSQNPFEMAFSFEDAGLKRLHLVDLDAAKTGGAASLGVLEEIASKTSLEIDFAGGIRNLEAIKFALGLGAAKVNIGTLAIRDPGLVRSYFNEFGSASLILAADVMNYFIAISGWQEISKTHISSFLFQFVDLIPFEVTCTSISQDGLLKGPDFRLYESLVQAFPSLMINASGGISSIDDIYKLQDIGVSGVVIGKALYEEKLSLKELGSFVC